MENWKEVPNTNGKIFVSNYGRVKSFLRNECGSILKSQFDQKGYKRVTVVIDGKKTTYKVHRLVAEMFIKSIPGKNQVNHKDGNKENNFASNLEWVTNSENCQHACDNGLWNNQISNLKLRMEEKKTPIVAVNIKTGEKKYYESISAAEREIGSRHICDVLKGKRTQASGYHFTYARG